MKEGKPRREPSQVPDWGRRFAPLDDLSPFDVRVEEQRGVIKVHVPIASSPSAVRAGIFQQATQPLRLEGEN